MLKTAKSVKDYELNEVISGENSIVVDCWADWCGPCKMLSTVMDEIASEYDGKLTVLKANIDDCPDAIKKYEIVSLPTILFIKNGQLVSKTVGLTSKEKIEDNIKEAFE